MKNTDEFYMQKAISLALKGTGTTHPNPIVGCIIVKNNKIIGEGYHKRYGDLHAERNALKNCIENPENAEMYVTLEPCCHYGKTPPCTEAIIENKISKVIIGSVDSNPLVSNKGIEKLKANNINVKTGVLEAECLKINEVFFHYIKNKTPFISMKYAMSLDGKIATSSGESKWITGEDARLNVQNLRNKYTGIMVGIGTVLTDNPSLDCRIPNGNNPIRIICDSKLSIPLNSKIVCSSKEIPTIIAYNKIFKNKEKLDKLNKFNIETISISSNENKTNINLYELFKILGNRGIDSILVEGGGRIHASLLENNLINKVYSFIAPKLIGGKDALTPIEGAGILNLSSAPILSSVNFEKLGDSFLISGIIKNN
ncbi:MAG: bifunctional diaminohydroxyphosphoribosylaminopyrimidine deaminase/5-amino-6-(5-phosphoribosylamino)uracil reductase RibD [Clostridiales bacterium]